MIDISQISKLIIKKKLKVLSNSEKLQLKQFNKQYPYINSIDFEELIDKTSKYKSINSNEAWEAIIKKSQKGPEKPVVSLYQRSLFRYVSAAMLIGIVLTTYFFKNDTLSNTLQTNPETITNSITPGTDKAILTLENGSQIELRKGSTVQTESANSNGEEIVYEVGEQKATKISYNYLTVPRGGQFFIKLSDGTKVWLNSESQLKYPISFVEGETRVVELVYGEAYFDVSSSLKHNGAHFKVYNNNQEVEVLGTEFNIKAYKDELNIYTTLVEGKVDVSIEDDKQHLVPNQQLNLNLNTNVSIVRNVDVYNEISWKEGVFSFEEKSLKEIMKVLSRWYDIDVVFNDKSIENKEFVGVLRKNQNIKEILTGIQNFGVIKNFNIDEKIVVLE